MKNPYDAIMKYSDLERLLEETKCLHKECAESQRANELKAGLGYQGTKGYEAKGCYACDGYNKECQQYFSNKSLGED